MGLKYGISLLLILNKYSKLLFRLSVLKRQKRAIFDSILILASTLKESALSGFRPLVWCPN
jgi:hypothetical protein